MNSRSCAAITALAVLLAFALGCSTKPASTLEFEQGYPADAKTAQDLLDERDMHRAAQSYMWSFPAVSFQSIYQGSADKGLKWMDMLLADKFANSNSLFLTANTTTICAQCNFTVKDGPVVIELPAAPLVGMIDDFWQRSLTDLGLTGPDKSQGGKYFASLRATRANCPSRATS